ncbi:signal transduction histidine kinase [Anoxybacillus flavithermus NBRC 109594]|uniref:histidine kinase n=1 Tax=Anoxybacillus flavithermus NBRC 109594 TaxID=1315967 RepID=R4F9E9_9BACL|nr:sensor histidine kinase [Anoxybacillus flavithermus]GAC90081.1 signal transduction histidine kinase [Anoxybacillus flavithermus NBRC 109594]
MKIRTKLFVFIPLLVLLLNCIAFFIFQSGKKVQESYDVMMQRIFLYKQISLETQENVRFLSSYLIHQDEYNYKQLIEHKQQLEKLHRELTERQLDGNDAFTLENYKNMVYVFLDLEQAIIHKLTKQQFTGYADQYNEIEKIASFIREDSQALVDVELSLYQPVYKQILQHTARMNELGGTLFVLTTILSIVFAIWLSRTIVIPIHHLVHAAKNISAGQLNTRIPRFDGHDEIGLLGQTFQHMIENLRILISKNMEILEKEKLVRELELKALQSQINPHFLFNTLNVISKLAYIEGAEQTSELTVSTSNLLRYNLRKLDQPVTLREEVEHAKEYFAIQKARFRDRVTFEVKVDESCLEQPIPCLTLQPLIENAFIHGIEGMEEGANIQLIIEEKRNCIQITIADNGVGMPYDVQRAIMDASYSLTKTGHSTGLGLENVLRRLQLFYGVEKILEIKSAPNEGTAIILRLPRRERDVQAAHC